MTKRLLIYCEGQTEEMFVERLLRPHLLMNGIKVERPILAATSLDPSGQRGGFVNWQAIEFDLRQEFASDADPNLRFTTLLDVFRIPKAVPGMPSVVGPLTTVSDIEHIERAIEGVFNEPRFKAYLQRHELEALLLANTSALADVFYRDKSGIRQLANNISTFATAEDINHGPATHPAARLAGAILGYENLKASNAYFVLAEAGLESVRAKCPRFSAWLDGWEKWGNA